MKIKTKLISLIALAVCNLTSKGATAIITNASNGPGDPMSMVPADTLYALNDNSLMSGGIVSVGYFGSTVTSTDIDTIPELFALLGSFTSVTSISPGTSNVEGLGVFNSLPGYADQFTLSTNPTSLGTVNTGNILLNRNIYAIVSNASALTGVGGATLSSQFGLFFVGNLTGDDSPSGEVNLVASPSASSGALIGTFDTKTGDFSGTFGDPGTFNTFKLALAPVPEPSSALLGALGALALLRRRRN